MKQSGYAQNHESLMGAAVARKPGMHSHGGPWERGEATQTTTPLVPMLRVGMHTGAWRI